MFPGFVDGSWEPHAKLENEREPYQVNWGLMSVQLSCEELETFRATGRCIFLSGASSSAVLTITPCNARSGPAKRQIFNDLKRLGSPLHFRICVWFYDLRITIVETCSRQSGPWVLTEINALDYKDPKPTYPKYNPTHDWIAKAYSWNLQGKAPTFCACVAFKALGAVWGFAGGGYPKPLGLGGI